jgi:BRCA1-associated protein
MSKVEFWLGNPAIDLIRGTFQMNEEVIGEYLCMIDIPTSISVYELCSFLQPYLALIEEMRILRGDNNKFYLCIIKTHSSGDAESLIRSLSGKSYNPIEEYLCEIKSIRRVITYGNPPDLDVETELFLRRMDEKCPICLEDFEGCLVAVLCGHCFHWNCIVKCCDDTCPVCRYHQSPPDYSECEVCGEDRDTCLCLVCGFLGCKDHSISHFEETSHSYFQNIITREVWDYVNQQPIHRLIQGENKVVEVPGQQGDGKKASEVMFEYNALLSSLLETQRDYYHQKIQDLEKVFGDTLTDSILKLQQENDLLRKKVEEKNSMILEINFIKENITNSQAAYQKLVKENEELKASSKLKPVFVVNKEVEDQIKDLETQIRDLEFYLSSQKKLEGEQVERIEFR